MTSAKSRWLVLLALGAFSSAARAEVDACVGLSRASCIGPLASCIDACDTRPANAYNGCFDRCAVIHRKCLDEGAARCALVAKKTSPKSGAGGGNSTGGSAPTLAEWESFLGLHRGDTSERAIQLFGDPTSVRDKPEQPLVHMRFGGSAGLHVSYYRATKIIYGVTLSAGEFATNLRNKYPTDRRLGLLGGHPDALLRIFGPPTIPESSDTYIYSKEVAGHDNSMEVICYDFNQYVCSSVEVRWSK